MPNVLDFYLNDQFQSIAYFLLAHKIPGRWIKVCSCKKVKAWTVTITRTNFASEHIFYFHFGFLELKLIALNGV